MLFFRQQLYLDTSYPKNQDIPWFILEIKSIVFRPQKTVIFSFSEKQVILN